jgi:hypothetical protein
MDSDFTIDQLPAATVYGKLVWHSPCVLPPIMSLSSICSYQHLELINMAVPLPRPVVASVDGCNQFLLRSSEAETPDKRTSTL